MSISRWEKTFLVLSAFVVIVYVVGFASPIWLEKEVVIPEKFFKLKIEIGLFKSCKTITQPIIPISSMPPKTRTTEQCGSDGAAGWQFTAAGIAIATLVCSVIMMVLAFVLAFGPQVKGNFKLKCVLAISQFITVCGTTGVVIMFVDNNEFEGPFEMILNLDLGWGYFTAASAAPLGAIFMLFTILSIVFDRPHEVGIDFK